MQWDELLDVMEDRVAAHDRSLRLGTPAPGPLEVPSDIGPLPFELKDRAECVLAATRLMAQRVMEARDQVAQALREGSAANHREPAAYVDRMA